MMTRRHFLAASASVAAGLTACAFAAETPPAQAKMLTRPIPATGEQIPVIGLGTYGGMMTNDLEPQTLAPKHEVLKLFFDAGGRVIDTAPSYGNAEQVIGIVTTNLGINNDLFIATKVLERGDESTGLRSYQRSLDHLKRDPRGKLELMQCHNFIEWNTHLKTMRQWKDQGKFRYIGVTHYQDHAHEELERIIKRDKVDFLQINYSAAEPKAAKRLLPAAKDLGVATLINRPFAAGQIFKKVAAKSVPEAMQPYAKTWGAALIKFCLANDGCTCIIGATGNPAHMRENLQAGFGDFPDAEACKALAEAVA